MKEKREVYRFLRVTPRRIYDQLDQYVVGQKRAKEVLAIAAYTHLKRIEYLKHGGAATIRKSNVLMIGPSGSGKTHLARTLARILDVPFAYNDATAFTEAGYYGEDVELAIGRLLYETDQDIERAENGIVFIDEIDKIARRQSRGAGSAGRDIGGEGVQQSLLKVLDGEKLFVPTSGGTQMTRQDCAEINISSILFICSGSFSDIKSSDEVQSIGFIGDKVRAGKTIQTEELVSYGFLPELLGRLPVRVQLDPLTEEDLMDILTEPRDALVPEYQRLCSLDQIQLEFEVEALAAVAQAALRQGTGARGLRAIMELVLHPVLFEGPERAGERTMITSQDVSNALEDLA